MNSKQNKQMNIIGGGWQLSVGHTSDSKIHDPLQYLLALWDAGITTFDCGDIYVGVEELFGEFRKYLAQERGDEAVNNLRIHTKFVPDEEALHSIDLAYVERIIDRSRLRLGMDTLDLVQFHWWDYTIPGMVETAQILETLVKKGKIKEIGLTNTDTLHTKAILDAGVSLASNQIQYSLLDNRPENGMLALAKTRNIKIYCYGTLAGGFLSSKYLGVSEPAEPFANRSLKKYSLMIQERGGWEKFQELLKTLSFVAELHKVSIASVAVRYIIDKPEVTAVILGMSQNLSKEHIKEITNLSLTTEDLQKINEKLSEFIPVNGDVYVLERSPQSVHYGIIKRNLNKLN